MSKSQSIAGSCQKKIIKKKTCLFNLTLHNSSSAPNAEQTNENMPTRKIFKSRLPTNTPRQISLVPGKTFDLKFQSNSSKKNQKRKNGTRTTRKKELLPKKPLEVYQERLQNIIMRNSPKLSGFICAAGFSFPDESFKRGENLDVSIGQSSTTDESNEGKDLYSVDIALIKATSYDPEILAQDVESSPKANDENNGIFEHAEQSPTPALAKETTSPEEISQISAKVCPIITQEKAMKSYANTTVLSKETLSIQETTSPEELSSPKNTSSSKVFPIFTQKSRMATHAHKRSESKSPPVKKRKTIDEGPEQMILDAGQKQFGATQCQECHMVYCPADPVDKAAHRKFHLHLQEALKFPGWKKERVVQEYPEDSGRVLLILPEDPKYMRKKLEEVNQVMSQDLGFLATSPFTTHHSKIFLYVRDKEICGCCVADPVEQGYRIIPVDHEVIQGQRPWRCSQVPEPASVGISRLWVAATKRKSGIASKLVDCARQWFNYGTLIPKFKVAFTDPTQDGYQFASKYIGTSMFLVYK